MSWLMIALLALAVAAVVGAEWPKLSARFGPEARKGRERARRKAALRVVHTEVRTESEEFERSVKRDLDELPTIEESDRRNR